MTGRERLDVVAAVVGERMRTSRPLVVVSALAGVTDGLTRAATLAERGELDGLVREIGMRHEQAVAEAAGGCGEAAAAVGQCLRELERLLRGVSLLGECSPRTLAQILSLGERMSSQIVAAGLRARGIAARAVDAAELIVTNDHHAAADVDFPATEEKVGGADLPADAVPVVTGFLGATPSGERTVLGRGGSDYSAAVLGWALPAEAVEIWTDVDGVLTADPTSVPEARPLRTVGYAELLELSHWGAKVVHPKTVRPLRERGIPLWIRNTCAPRDLGTRVVEQVEEGVGGPVRGIASVGHVAVLQLSGFGQGETSVAARLLSALRRTGTEILMVSQACSQRSVCVAIPGDSVDGARRAVLEEFDMERRAGLMDEPLVDEGCAVIAVVGDGMKARPGISGRVFGVLGREGINVRAIAQGSSELNISFVVQREEAQRAVRAVHEEFFGSVAAGPDPSRSGDSLSLSASAGSPDVVELARRLVEIPSVSGSEAAVVRFVAGFLEDRGWRVTRQEVAPGRDNIWATMGRGEVTLSTHLDTVPGFPTPRIHDGRLFGRGACDAKGIAAAMLCAAERLRAAGEERVDLLFVVGEEDGSPGARAAKALPTASRWLVNGEPTEGRIATGARGALRVVVRAAGVEAHSGYPERGVSAIDAMVGLLSEIPALDLPRDPVLGPTQVNVGVVRGGTAANVTAGACEAELMIRLVGDDAEVRRTFESWAAGRAELEWGSLVPPQRFHVLDGFETVQVGYTSDTPFLESFGTPVLFGPGSIHHAHTDHEHIALADLRRGVDDYVTIVQELLSS